MNKNDISRARTPQDSDARWNFAKNHAEVKKAQQDINQNIDDIKGNTAMIEDNTNDIAQNTEDIEQIKEDILEINESLTPLQEEVSKNTEKRHWHTNKAALDEITLEEWESLLEHEHWHENKDILDLIEGTVEFNLEQYKNPNMTILVGNCISKNKRIVMNVSADINLSADTETILFSLPIELEQEYVFYMGIEKFKLNIDGTITIQSTIDLTHIDLNLVFDY